MLGACRPADTPEGSLTKNRPRATEHAPAWVKRLPATSFGRVREERQRFAQAEGPSGSDEPPKFSPLGPERVRGFDGPTYRMESYLDGVEPGPGPLNPAPPVQVHNLAFARSPGAQLGADGTIQVRFTSDRPLAGGRVDYGVKLQGFGLPRTIYRKSVPIESWESGSAHPGFEARVPVPKLLADKVHVEKGRSGGRGMVALRVRVLDRSRGAERFDDLEVHYRCLSAPCRPDSQFVQLPSFTLGPILDRVTPSGAVVSVETDVPTWARVVVLAEGGARFHFDSARFGKRHEVQLSGLNSGQAHRYWVFVRDGRGEISEALEGAFRTVPDAVESFRFAVMSDSRAGVGAPDRAFRGSNRDALEDLSTWVWARGSDFVVFPGDLINGYTTEPGAYRHELKGFFRSVQPVASRIPFYESMGNHELLMAADQHGFMHDLPGPVNSQSLFRELVVNPENGPTAKPGEPSYSETVYSFDHGPVHVAVLNTNYFYRSHMERADHPAYGRGVREGYLTDAQLAWLDQDLKSARARGQLHLFVATHEPAFPSAGHVKDAMYWDGRVPEVLERRDAFWSVLVRHRVLAAFFGDEHSYTRTLVDASVNPKFDVPVWQLVSGGAGAPYYALDETVPWAGAIRKYLAAVHFCELEVRGPEVWLRVIDDRGQVLETVALHRRGEG